MYNDTEYNLNPTVHCGLNGGGILTTFHLISYNIMHLNKQSTDQPSFISYWIRTQALPFAKSFRSLCSFFFMVYLWHNHMFITTKMICISQRNHISCLIFYSLSTDSLLVIFLFYRQILWLPNLHPTQFLWPLASLAPPYDSS